MLSFMSQDNILRDVYLILKLNLNISAGLPNQTSTCNVSFYLLSLSFRLCTRCVTYYILKTFENHQSEFLLSISVSLIGSGAWGVMAGISASQQRVTIIQHDLINE